MKPTVYYRNPLKSEIREGYGATIEPIGHPKLDSDGSLAYTSQVLRVGKNGEFETLNTIYKLEE